MELLDRYLQAVKKHLPWQRQDDIIAELRANLEAQLEEREAELGRALNAHEAEEWLKGLGHPMLMAAKYQPVQYLIGPGIFPMYWYVLRLTFLWATAIYAVVNAIVIPLTSHDPTSVLHAVLRWPDVLISTAAWVTLVFAVLEFVARRFPGTIPQLDAVTTEWKPGTLPPLERSGKAGAKQPSYAKAVAEAVFGFLFLGWLLLVPGHPFLLLGPGAFYLNLQPIELGPVWWQFYWCVVALNVVQVGWKCLDLLTGEWQGSHLVQHLVTKVLGLVPLALLQTVPNHLLFVLKDPVANETKYAATLYSINEGTHKGLAVVCAIVVLQLLWDLGQAVVTAYRTRSSTGY